jgi:elongation factor G
VFENKLIGSAIPDRFITPIREGSQTHCTRGVLAGYPIRDGESSSTTARSTMSTRRNWHSGTRAMAFPGRGQESRAGAARAGDARRVGDSHELHRRGDPGPLRRRGQMHSRKTVGDRQIVLAFVPLAELFGYAINLRANTRGRATHSHQLDRYQEVRADPGIEDDDGTSPVRAPLTPSLRPNESAVALPEPDDDGPEP